MKLILELRKKRSLTTNAGFALASTLILLSVLAGMQLWQLHIYHDQMQTYTTIERSYRLDMLTNQVRLQLIDHPEQTEYKIGEIQVLLKDQQIFIKYPNGDKFQRQFSQSQ
ncbi:hypothetical protein EQG49_02205 [Periweissella cryptocerci]|uniref:Uncharacterized protein n=1 Tax=Periweissella cryptocerci TaxID=2506420 RepID=A0A4P6YRW8_9LACO|nr:hypothetical protein [Periweissella cryptocerci]QBO35360.1 hypothetical protein EQG49_02205 [Periweissella cryptocerci]